MRRRGFAILLLVFGFLVAPQAVSAVSVAPFPAPVGDAPEQLAPETTAVISADGDCLRFREQPGLNARSIRCIDHGTRVQVADGFTSADGMDWQLVLLGGEVGWVAAMY